MKNVIQGTTLTGTGAVHVAPGAEITIRNPAGQLVPLWADRAGTQPHDNPFQADAEGHFRVYADSGWVHIRAQKAGSVREWRYVPIGSAAAMDIGEVYAALGSEIYSSVSEGLGNSAEGDYFLVESSGSLDLYRVVNGVAEQRELGIEADAILATRAYADGVAADAESNATNAAVAAASSAYQQATEYSDSQLQTHRESGDHDGRYYTKTQVDQALDDKVDENDPRLSDAREWTAEVVSQSEAEAGTSSVPRKWTAERVRQAIEALGGGGIDPGDLGTAATRDVTTSPTDTTPGRVLKVGDFGVGSTINIPPGSDLNDYITPGEYRQDLNVHANPALNYPVQLAGVLKVMRVTGGGCVQEYTTHGVTRRKFLRGLYGGAWSGWAEFYHTGNIDKLISDANLVQTSRAISAGTGLTGGGNLSANRTISLASSHYPIGVGQTWQNVTSSRALDTTYTNTTGRPIMVSIIMNESKQCAFTVGGVPVVNANNVRTICAVVPAGAQYRLSSSTTISYWSELMW